MTTGNSGCGFWMETNSGLILAVKALPRAKRIRIGPVVAAARMPGWPDHRLKVAVNAAPEGGQANEAIRRALADWLGIGDALLVQQAGTTARDKKFLVINGKADDFVDQFSTV